MILLEKDFYNTVFNIIDYLTKSQLTVNSKKLIIVYITDSLESLFSTKARAAIKRYTNTDIPILEDIRKKSQAQELSALDHLVLKMEYAAKRLQDST